jgi:hypothetical protein
LNANLLIGTIAVISVLALVGLVEAEAEEVTIEVPHDIDYQDCMTFADQFGTPFTQCIFEGIVHNPEHLSTETDDGCIEEFDRDFNTGECRDPAIIMEEAIAKYEAEIAIVEENKTPKEKLIDSLIEDQERRPLKPSEKQLLDALEKNESVCRNNILQIQSYNEFDVSVDVVIDQETGEKSLKFYKNWDLVAIDLKSNYILKHIYLNTEACIAQNTLATKIITESTTNKVIDDSTSTKSHTEMAQSKAIYPQSSLDASRENSSQSIRNTICESQHFTQGFKDQHACPKPDYVSTIEPTHTTALGDEGRVIKWANEQFRSGDVDAIEDQYDKVKRDAIERKMENLK